MKKQHPELSQLLDSNKTFCMFPWIHLYVNTDGEAYPCCTTKYENPVGNVRNQTIEEIWNSEELKEVRRKLLAGEVVEGCANCYKHESTGGGGFSFRNFANNEFGHNFDLVKDTLEDGTLPGMHLKYFDVRFSNLCNFKCRTCGDLFSSTWAAESYKAGYGQYPGVTHASNGDPGLLEQFKPHLGNLEMLYFAGGEPLITPEHYQILEFLIENNSTDVTIRYNSNSSKLRFGDTYVIDLWNKFNKIEFYASLDSYGRRAEYMRHGTIWPQVIKNLQTIRDESPTTSIAFNCVVGAFNVMTITDFLEDLHNHSVIDYKTTYCSFYKLINPDHYNLNNVYTIEMKREVKNKIGKFLETMEDGPIKHGLTDIYHFIQEDTPPIEEHMKMFKSTTLHLDKLRNENFVESFPELKEWYENI
jgi:radical SAM protein with 4Fe4S-binding SPASM domain